MIGFILGLGDRHAENILISQKTGACLHVDFTCLFDHGKGLDVPETVPFRLTQNIVDGMGVLKTDGAFTAAAILVMETLRTKKQKVLAVLNGFVNDPLTEWTAPKQENAELAAKQAGIQARRTLKEVEGRLIGLSEDRSRVSSPDCVVRELIARATDITSLAEMYHGWQPFL
jgi:serine/threonine-protein kinase ATR